MNNIRKIITQNGYNILYGSIIAYSGYKIFTQQIFNKKEYINNDSEIFEFYKVENYMGYFGKIGVNGKTLDEDFLCIDSLKSDFNYHPKTKFIDGVKKLYKHTYNE